MKLLHIYMELVDEGGWLTHIQGNLWVKRMVNFTYREHCGRKGWLTSHSRNIVGEEGG